MEKVTYAKVITKTIGSGEGRDFKTMEDWRDSLTYKDWKSHQDIPVMCELINAQDNMIGILERENETLARNNLSDWGIIVPVILMMICSVIIIFINRKRGGGRGI